MKNIISALIASICIAMLLNVPLVSAQNYDMVSQKVKYYKTITYYNKNDLLLNNLNSNLNFIPYSETFEISEEEYLKASDDNNQNNANPVSSETTYQKMTSSIYSNGSYYRYKNEMEWKKMPTVRSYDIIAIGFNQSVKLHGNTYFLQEYCYTNGTCASSTSNDSQVFASGAGTTFKLPTGTLSSLKQTFYFDVEKNTSSTIVSQYAFSDYSHAIKTITKENAKKYSVSRSLGIVLNSSIDSYYDVFSVADASWSGTW